MYGRKSHKVLQVKLLGLKMHFPEPTVVGKWWVTLENKDVKKKTCLVEERDDRAKKQAVVQFC